MEKVGDTQVKRCIAAAGIAPVNTIIRFRRMNDVYSGKENISAFG